MGCQNGKPIDASKKSKTELYKLLIDELNLLQRNILSANMLFQVKTNMNKHKDAKNQHLENSVNTNDNSINHDLNVAFIEQMRDLQSNAKDLLTKASYLLEQNADPLTESLRTTLKQKVECLQEFAFTLKLDAQVRPSEDEIQGLGDLCESVIIA